MGITQVALDDGKRVIVAGIWRAEAAEPEVREIPNDARHLRRLLLPLLSEAPVRACHEAGVSGYELYCQLRALGVVVAPALTPRRPGERVKTDRRDAAKLVRLFRAGELTPIHVPTEAEEGVRDLMRCREDVRAEIIRWRHRTLKLLARHGRLYQAGRNWSARHRRRIRAQQFEDPALGRAFAASLFALEQALVRQADLDQDLATLATTDRYRAPVAVLRCFRGLDTLSALILLAEITDFARFRRPRQLLVYVGLVPSEYSSGERQRRGAIAKAGNTHARRILVEAAWHYRHPPRLGPALAARCAGQPAALVAEAWRAQQRLHRRYRHLSAMASGRPLPSSRARASYSGSSGPPCDRRGLPRRPHEGGERLLRCGGGGGPRPESPRRYYATADLRIGATRAPRRRQLPTNPVMRLCPTGQSAHISLTRRRDLAARRPSHLTRASLQLGPDPTRRLTTGPSISVARGEH